MLFLFSFRDIVDLYNANGLDGMSPLCFIGESFGEYISGHFRRRGILTIYFGVRHLSHNDLMEGGYRDPMSTVEVTHGWVPARLDHTNHGLIVLMKDSIVSDR